MAWTMDWHDLTDRTNNSVQFLNTRVGSIPANEREFAFRMTAPSTIKFTVPLAHPMGRRIASAPDGFGVVSLYQDGVLRMNAETVSIITNNEGSQSTVAVNAVEPLRSRLATVPACFSTTALSVPDTTLTPFTFPQTPGQAGARLYAERSAMFSLAGVPITTAPGATASISSSNWDIDVSALDLMDALANRASGFDYWMEPVELQWRMGLSVLALLLGPVCGILRVENIRGSAKPAAVIEYGTGRLNAKKYQLSSLAGEQLVTGASVVAQAAPTDPAAHSTQLPAAQLETFGLRTQVILSDLEDIGLRTQLAEEIVTRRGTPRQLASITPMPYTPGGSVPRPFVEYGLGDIIPIKVVDEGLTMIDGNVRVYGIIVSPDANDMENVELELTPDTN